MYTFDFRKPVSDILHPSSVVQIVKPTNSWLWYKCRKTLSEYLHVKVSMLYLIIKGNTSIAICNTIDIVTTMITQRNTDKSRL